MIQQRTKTGEWAPLTQFLCMDPEEANEVLEALADPTDPANAASGEYRLAIASDK